MYHALMKASQSTHNEPPVSSGQITLEGHYHVDDDFYMRPEEHLDHDPWWDEMVWWFCNPHESIAEMYEHLPNGQAGSLKAVNLKRPEHLGGRARRDIDDQGPHYSRTRLQNQIRKARANTHRQMDNTWMTEMTDGGTSDGCMTPEAFLDSHIESEETRR